MTEKKQGVPVQEPVPAEEPAKAGDNNKIWHYNGKFPVVVDLSLIHISEPTRPY